MKFEVHNRVSDFNSYRAVRDPQPRKYATWEPPFDDHARLYRPELLAIPGEVKKTDNHCVLGRATCGEKYPCKGCRFQEKNPQCAHGLWKCPLGNTVCDASCAWFNGEEKTA